MRASSRTPAMVLCAVLAAASPATAAPAPLWDHPGYDAEDSHFNPRETTINSATINQVKLKWQVRLRTGDESCSGFSEPVLSGGRIYVSDQLGISAYAANSGKISWRYDWELADDSRTPRLAVTDGLLIIAGGGSNSPSDPNGELVALDAGTGLPRWRRGLESPAHEAVIDKGVIVISGGSPSDEDVVAAYSARDGRALWTLPHFLTSEVSADGVVLVRSTDGSGQSAGVDIRTGKALWTRKASWTAQASNPAGDRFVVSGGAGMLGVVRVADGTPVWPAAAASAASASVASASAGEDALIAVDSNRFYRVFGRSVEAVSLLDGKKAWTVRQTVDGSQPVLAGGLLYAGGGVLNSTDGKPAGPAHPGTVIIAGGQIHQIHDGVVRSFTL